MCEEIDASVELEVVRIARGMPRVLMDLILDYITWNVTKVDMFQLALFKPKRVLASDDGLLVWDNGRNVAIVHHNGVLARARMDDHFVSVSLPSKIGCIYSDSLRKRTYFAWWQIDPMTNVANLGSPCELTDVESAWAATCADGHMWVFHDFDHLSKFALHPDGQRLDSKQRPQRVVLSGLVWPYARCICLAVVKNIVALANWEAGEMITFHAQTGERLNTRRLQRGRVMISVYENFVITSEKGWLEVLNPLTLSTEAKIQACTSGVIVDFTFYHGKLLGVNHWGSMFAVCLRDSQPGGKWDIAKSGQIQTREKELVTKQRPSRNKRKVLNHRQEG